ncbi:orotidine-5'-phosphate decarboxylase [Methylovulum psychrotolerans]|jgi:orotidine-5'-phosphate decarboxylase|uniref:Orotidine 5'-phosphate decarboxylase n=1 Tax=Methylovulum psychrotolerans TaxID=1704499 RepID=A0A2S5CGI9_9GAMM|nr:orotidine-5'-phosphate decarboxylase [Methylovulum psychrotolerans]MBT9096120.1 orotidine-5'-phosphate decarboxylase [Methylovulum psychrotolerans]POZ49914.1 orotidine-5'-phosphate decarboxylase [Methylovulum psychrotolerans]
MSPVFLSTKPIPVRERLIMALDVSSIPEAQALVEELGDSVVFYKVGMELFMSGDYFGFIEWLKQRHKKVFVDLKFFDIPATVGRAIKALSSKGVDLATIHGNDAIMEAAAQAKGDLKVLAVTALTSLDRGDLDDLGFQCDIRELVLSRAKRALQLGCDGIVSSGLEAAMIREQLGQRLLVITPGIRPVDNREEEDQKRVVSVEMAFEGGADYIVVGRPIRDAADRKAMAETIQAQILSVLATANP